MGSFQADWVNLVALVAQVWIFRGSSSTQSNRDGCCFCTMLVSVQHQKVSVVLLHIATWHVSYGLTLHHAVTVSVHLQDVMHQKLCFATTRPAVMHGVQFVDLCVSKS
jgi:hypothetical protein